MKFYRHLVTAGALGALAVIPACSDEQGPSSDGAGIELKIGAVTYANAIDLCYGFAIHNPAGQLVVKQDNICASDYGNDGGGDFAYVAPCDASQQGMSTVTLWLKGIQIGVNNNNPVWEPEADYINPCGLTANLLETANVAPYSPGDWPANNTNYDGTICQQKVQCVPNADRPVTFNLTIMRDAKQGFFDVIVDFEDIFCSAKLDTCYSNTGDQIELLFDMDDDAVLDPPGEGPRDETAVMALACTGGPETYDPETGLEKLTTKLHYSNIVIKCEQTNGSFDLIPLDPTGTVAGGAGNQAATQFFNQSAIGLSEVKPLSSPVNFSLFWGKEALSCGTYDPDPEDPDNALLPLSCNKKYWNIAVNLEDLQELGYKDCTLEAQATATSSDGLQLVNGQLQGDGVSYAAIDFADDVLVDGDASCDWNPLNGLNSERDDSGVQSNYYGTGDIIGIDNLRPMCYWKNSENDGDPQYTQFTDYYSTLANAKDLGRLGGRAFKGEVGGRHGANCYRGIPAANEKEIATWNLDANLSAAAFSLGRTVGTTDTIGAQFYGYRNESWQALGNGIKLNQIVAKDGDVGYIVNLGVGYQRIALALDGREATDRVAFEINSTGIIDTGINE